jgi:translation elongation factor P/translation initiation factor 5A
MKKIKILKALTVTAEEGSIINVTEKQLEYLESFKNSYVLVEDEEPEKGEVKKPKLAKKKG